ncbi:MAG: hypothetical protein DMF54_01785 [Acidobacteria bacterium]|nr:MAG: hypothetical protein DMF54_01785 [Acidobacteriota bacterium]
MCESWRTSASDVSESSRAAAIREARSENPAASCSRSSSWIFNAVSSCPMPSWRSREMRLRSSS